MLARGATRRQRRETARVLAASFAQLNLPWLAPAQLRWQASQTASSSSSHAPRHPRRRSTSRSKPPVPQRRALATAVDQYAPRPSQYPPPGYSSAFRNSGQDRHIPWATSSSQTGSTYAHLRPSESPITLSHSRHTEAAFYKAAPGLHGTVIDLLQHLHTSLHVGRVIRAEAIIKRLAESSLPESSELLHAHATYLEDFQRRIALLGEGQESRDLLHQMQKWFEVEIKDKGIAVDARLLVPMIRASIRALTGSRRERTIQRYVSMAEELGEDNYYEVVESEEYEDNEFAILCRIVNPGDQSDPELPAIPAVTEILEDDAHPAPKQRGDLLPLDKIPDVLQTTQRGLGLSGIKRTLADFATDPSVSAQLTPDELYEQALRRQTLVEETSVDVAIDHWRKADEELRKLGINTAMQSRPIAALMWQWYTALLPALQAELVECKKVLSNPGVFDDVRLHYGPYLEVLPLDKIAANTILYVLGKVSTNYHTEEIESAEIRLSQLAVGLARAIEQEFAVHSGKPNSKGAKHSASSRKARARVSRFKESEQSRKKRSKAEEQRQALLAQLHWPLDVKVKLGALLASKMIETAHLPVTRQHPRTQATVTQMQPAFLHRTKYDKGKKIGVVCSNPALIEKAKSEPLGSIIAKRMPMIVEPKPWSHWNKGGYLRYSNDVVRQTVGDKSGRDYFMAAHQKGDMEQIYAGLTALGAVPWKIHHGVFKVQLEAWNSGEGIANFAPLNPDLDMPAEPPAANATARKEWLREMRALENKRGGLHSQRCFQNFQLEIARTMVNEVLYFPHNMDFRGRAYPIPPYLNHMGADNVRGLLVFAEGKELGENGLRWLKIHLATVAGHDKASMSERVEFTMSHLDDIYDSVRNPLDGRRWWLQAEDAWQTLAACFELSAALDSPDPTKFISHLPVQQDGTCNGLQHYAALGGDMIGAAQVNLVPGDRPADVYSAVARSVMEEVHKDATAGDIIALKLDGHLTRKCVKQPVMTNVYGVTYFGAKLQVRKQLAVLFPDTRSSDDVNLDCMARYVTTKIFKALGEMFAGAQAIQTWLGVCADRISTCLTPSQIAEITEKANASSSAVDEQPPTATRKRKSSSRPRVKKPDTVTNLLSHQSTGTAASSTAQVKSARPLFKTTVVWTTPLRLPVVQPYRSANSRKVTTNMQQLYLQDPQAWHPVSKRKQLQAFPPNFIHSLDATHMLLSALKCKENGMTFASIHDSFWTHACDVNRLSVVLRDAFIEMHQDNIIGRLREEFQTRYKDCMYLASVIASSDVGRKITAFRKERKVRSEGELVLEAERLRLLHSSDPAERAKGESMVTPGSIFTAEGNEASLAASPEIERQQLGTVLQRPEDDAVDMEAAGSDADSDLVVPTDLEGDDGLASDAEAVSAHRGPNEPPSAKAVPGVKRPPKKIYVWQPLTFPAIPPRGSFDVARIRESAYFFH